MNGVLAERAARVDDGREALPADSGDDDTIADIDGGMFVNVAGLGITILEMSDEIADDHALGDARDVRHGRGWRFDIDRRFYRDLAGRPFREERGQRAARLAVLLAVQQAANAAGFLAEMLTRHS